MADKRVRASVCSLARASLEQQHFTLPCDMIQCCSTMVTNHVSPSIDPVTLQATDRASGETSTADVDGVLKSVCAQPGVEGALLFNSSEDF